MSRKRMIDAEWDQAYDEWISGAWMYEPGAWMYEPGGPFASRDDCLCPLDGGLMPDEHDLRCTRFVRKSL